ncbi:hypothetical protein JM93_02527 [Roseibium hamelinense]|uniref:Uncharacterized protein n=1 Tax=Roseibium hamelinense TaxID=150831 RepID=A0A562T321_9HYPH|nr:hypothetical protein [Roseibium hamelinense]MTI44658.1 hypothetical protein [Roseibium hamelinense]TWI87286.1 hypothetical protein JM93_02527 [Roseibium hamelinense]
MVNYIGFLVDIRFSDENTLNNGNYIVYCDSDQNKLVELGGPETNFKHGIFPSPMCAVLIWIKNKLGPVTSNGGGKFCTDKVTIDAFKGNIEAVNLVGVIVNGGVEKLKEHLCYSVLPLFYICEDGIGKKQIKIFNSDLNAESVAQIYSGQKTINLMQDGEIGMSEDGSFYVKKLNPSEEQKEIQSANIARVFKLSRVYSEEFSKNIGDFQFGAEKTGVESQQDLQAIAEFEKRDAISGVLNNIQHRWFEARKKTNPEEIKNYNIGAFAALKMDGPQGQPVFKPLLQSLNIKGTNKAAHAETRIAYVMDYLQACVQAKNSPLVFKHLYQRLLEQENATLYMFSSLLPCYMCAAEVLTDMGGYVQKIGENDDYGIPMSFKGLPQQTMFFSNIEYLDVDANIEYRELTATFTSQQQQQQQQQLQKPKSVSITPYAIPDTQSQSISSLLCYPNGAPASLASLQRAAVSDAGSSVSFVGLQNDPAMERYALLSRAIKLPKNLPQAQSVFAKQAFTLGNN